MNEKDIRDRIGQFLKRTARTVVVPASMGLGLSSTACNGNGLHRAGDAGLETGSSQADAKATSPDLAEDAVKFDVPLMMVPYVVAMPPDAAAADISSPPPPYLLPPPDRDAGTVWKLDTALGDADGDALPDTRPDLAAQEAARPETFKDTLPDVRAEVRFPEPPYLLPAMVEGPLLGPTPPAKK